MKLNNLGISFSVEINKRAKEVSELILFFSVMLLFGTFLVGIAQFLLERQVTIEDVKLLTYRVDYFHTLIHSGSAIIGGCLVGLIGLLFHILFYNVSLRNYIVNGFLINAIFFILFGTLYFILYMVSNQIWLIIVISVTFLFAAIGVITYHILKMKKK